MVESKRFNLAVLGAAGGIGQPLSMLLNSSPFVKELHLYDVIPLVRGVAVDISHVPFPVVVKGYAGNLKDKVETQKALKEALTGMDICVIPAGVPRKPGMTRDDLFGVNAGIVAQLVTAIADYCPKAMICIISNPVNSTVPIAAEILKKKGVYNSKKLFGVSTLDSLRTSKFIGEKLNQNPKDVNIDVIGGHSGVTILPLLSQAKGKLTQKELETLTKRIQNAGTEVVEAKAGGGSATLSMAYAGYRFANSLMKGMTGKITEECSYVPSKLTELPFFASRCKLGPEGCVETIQYKDLTPYEEKTLKEVVIPGLKKNIEKGVKYVANL